LEKTEDEILKRKDQLQPCEFFETLQSILSKSPEWDDAPDASDIANTNFIEATGMEFFWEIPLQFDDIVESFRIVE
jgi:hypothetical protein